MDIHTANLNLMDLVEYSTLDQFKQTYDSIKTDENWKFCLREAIKYWRHDITEFLLNLPDQTEGILEEKSFIIMCCVFHNSGCIKEVFDKYNPLKDEVLEIYEYAKFNRRNVVTEWIEKNAL